MRFVTLALALLLAAPSLAQAPPEAYYPLDVGNEWVYTFEYGGPRFLQHDRIVGAETVDGVAYTQRERCDTVLSGGELGAPDCELQRIRFTAAGDLVVRQPDGSEVAEACAVGAPTGTVTACDDVVGEDFALEVSQSGPTVVVVGHQTVEVDGVQDYHVTDCCIDPGPPGFAIGVGRLTAAFGNDVARFEYARVGEREYGVNPLDPSPASFDPVAAGSVREYEGGVAGSVRSREDSPRTLVLDGTAWTLRRWQTLTPPDESGFRGRSDIRELVRYDTLSAQVLQRWPDGTGNPIYPCTFDVPRGESVCTGGIDEGLAWREDGVTVGAPGDERTTSRLTYDTLGGALEFVAGIGRTVAIGDGSSTSTELVYADVGPLPTGDPLPFGTPLGEAFPTEIDPTPAHLYYPLSVGDEWHSEAGSFGVALEYNRRRVVGTEAIDSEVYAVVELSSATPDAPQWELDETRRVRFDGFSGFPVTDEGERLSVCPLDEPVNVDYGNQVRCDADGAYAAVLREGPFVQDVGPEIPTETVKGILYYGLADGVVQDYYIPGIGPVRDADPFGGGGSSYITLRYARVQQDDGSIRTFGAPVPVDAEDEAFALPLAVRAVPNPTAGAVRLAVTVPQAGVLRAEAFDALGRLVWAHAAAAAGPSELAVDASAWAPGAYVIRVQAGGEVATTRVVRR